MISRRAFFKTTVVGIGAVITGGASIVKKVPANPNPPERLHAHLRLPTGTWRKLNEGIRPTAAHMEILRRLS